MSTNYFFKKRVKSYYTDETINCYFHLHSALFYDLWIGIFKQIIKKAKKDKKLKKSK